MIPIRDDAPRQRHPFVTWFLIAVNVLAFVFELTLPAQLRAEFIFQFGLVPARFIDLARTGGFGTILAVIPLVTSMFLHSTVLHILFNMWALWIFGDNVEGHLGHFSYLIFYFVTGTAGSALHILINQDSALPSIGASGAIAGIMGAFFILYPSARVLTMVPIFVWLPAWVVLGYWFVVQFVSGAATAISSAGTAHGGGVAFWAHVGGFIAGVSLIKLFPADSSMSS